MADQKAPWEIDYAEPAPATAPTTGYTTPQLSGVEPKIPLTTLPSTQPPPKAPWQIDYATPTPPPEISPFEKAGRAFWEGLGMPTMIDLASGDEARAKHALTTLGQGILGELPRAGQELTEFGRAIDRGDWTMAGYHAAGAVPFFGAPVQQMTQDVMRGDPAAFVGHLGAVAAPFVAGPMLGTAGRGAQAAGTVTQGALRGAVGALPAAGKAALEKSFYGALGGPASMINAAKIAAAKEIGQGALQGAKEALAARATVPAAQAAAAQVAREAADAALARGALTYEEWERLTQPGPPRLPPATGYQMPPAGTAAEEARIAALRPEAISEATPAMVKAAQKVGNFTPEEQALADHILQNVAPAAPTMTPGQALAVQEGLDWSALKATDRLQMEQIAAARANFAEQQMKLVTPPSQAEAPITPVERAPTAEMSVQAQDLAPQPQVPPGSIPITPTTTPADVLQNFQQRLRDLEQRTRPPGEAAPPEEAPADLESQLAESIRQVQARKGLPVTATTTPAEVQASFEQAQAGFREAPTTTTLEGGIWRGLQDAGDAALARLRQRGAFAGGQLYALFPADVTKDMAIWGAAKMAKGVTDFSQWSKEMLADAGAAADQIRPHLATIYKLASTTVLQAHREQRTNLQAPPQ